jgi:2,3-bisphosphoglycerate-independent phosphoglycerate mutase
MSDLDNDIRDNDLRPIVLCIMDGWGHRESAANNAVKLAKTPHFDRFLKQYPHSLLAASGPDVGLPDGQVGNSEVGHMNIGAGRIVMQDLPRLNKATADGTLAAHPELAALGHKLAATGGRAHVMGLLSDGGVHSHQEHMLAVIKGLADAGASVCVHGFADGRDVLPKVTDRQFPAFAAKLPDNARFATVIGRYYAMDRDKRWERTAAAFEAIVHAPSDMPRHDGVDAAIAAAYDARESDEFISPRIIGDYQGMADGDAVIFINFRADRARQILSALLLPAEVGFDATPPKLSAAIGMTAYSDALDKVMTALFPPIELDQTLGEVVAHAGKRQLRLAETEKYPHVTFFFNGGDEACFTSEDRHLVPSPKVATYDLQPEMSAADVLAAALDSINKCQHDLLIINFANPDMVGHTGDLQAAIAAVETVDHCIGEIESALKNVDGQMLLTADHGNCEIMWDENAESPHTAHTTNPVPLILVNGPPATQLADGRLADLAPSLLAMLGIAAPHQMTGKSLLQPAQ